MWWQFLKELCKFITMVSFEVPIKVGAKSFQHILLDIVFNDKISIWYSISYTYLIAQFFQNKIGIFSGKY